MIRPASGRVLLKPVETAESVPGGRIILVQQAREEFAKWQYEVVAVGSPEFCDDEDCQRPYHCDCPKGRCGSPDDSYHTFSCAYSEGMGPRYGDPKRPITHPVDHRLVPGAWCIIEPRSLMDACVDGEKFYYVRQSAIVGVFMESDAKPLDIPRGNRSLEERHAKERGKQIARDHAAKFGEKWEGDD